MLKFISLSFLLLVAFFGAQAQRIDKHSLSLGLSSGSLKLHVINKVELNASNIGLNLNHQANITSWFSWRTGFNASYVFPVIYHQSFIVPVSDPDPTVAYPVGRESVHSHWLLNLDLMPSFYYRDEGFKLFIALSGTLGTDLQKMESTEERLKGSTLLFEENDPQKEKHFQLGWGPVGGVGFDLGGKRKGGEIELALSYRNYYNLKAGNIRQSMTGFGLLTSYRYYFKY